MARRKFSLAALNALNNGEVDEQFIALQKLLIKDCEDRPFVGKPRVMTIKLTYTPVIAEGSGVLDEVAVRAEFSHTAPKYASRAYNMKSSTSGDLIFNDLAPEGPHQRTIDELTPAKKAQASKHIQPDEASDTKE